MSLLALHEPDLEAASVDLVRRPIAPPPASPKFSAWGLTTAAPRGMGAGAAESSGFMADVLGAFGHTMAATDARAGGMFAAQTEDERRQEAKARQELITDGPRFTSEAGDLFRNVGRSYRPDSQTAHVAEQLVFDASRVITKAVGYSIAGGGPLPGAVLTGFDEGSMVSDDLRLQGVDKETRTKAAAVQGAGVALGVALPVAGRTLFETAALVAVGGPGTFVAQQALTREILQDAGYEQLGAQFDPFDPVGLAVSTLVPAAFGGWALRRARAAQPVPGETKPAGAETPPAEPAPPRVEAETVDAARVALAVQEAEAGRLTNPADLPARAVEDQLVARAEEQLAAGEPVHVDIEPTLFGDRASQALEDFTTQLRLGFDEAEANAPRDVQEVAARDLPQQQPRPDETPGQVLDPEEIEHQVRLAEKRRGSVSALLECLEAL